METSVEDITALFTHLEGKDNRIAIFSHYRVLNYVVAERSIRRLYKWEREENEYLTGNLLCTWIADEMERFLNS